MVKYECFKERKQVKLDAMHTASECELIVWKNNFTGSG